MREEYAVQELKNVKIQLKNEINLLHIDIEKLNAGKEQYELNAKLYDVQKQHIIQILQEIYDVQFKTIEEAIDYSELHVANKSQEQVKVQVPQHQIEDEIKIKIAREQKRRKTAEKVVFSLQEDLGKAQLEIKKLKEQNNNYSFNKERVDQLEEEKALIIADYKH